MFPPPGCTRLAHRPGTPCGAKMGGRSTQRVRETKQRRVTTVHGQMKTGVHWWSGRRGLNGREADLPACRASCRRRRTRRSAPRCWIRPPRSVRPTLRRRCRTHRPLCPPPPCAPNARRRPRERRQRAQWTWRGVSQGARAGWEAPRVQRKSRPLCAWLQSVKMSSATTRVMPPMTTRTAAGATCASPKAAALPTVRRRRSPP